MPDALPPGWGVRPVLPHLGGLPVPAYEALVALAVLAGLALLAWDGRRAPRRGDLVPLALAGLWGGAVGAKLLEWAFHPALLARIGWLAALAGGRTVLGGFLGGALAVALVKRWLGITGRRGNLLAAPVALGLAVGRVGCFLHGCCYGTPTALPWGVDFGDGVPRHPTQLYEAAFALAALGVLLPLRRRPLPPGRLFGGLMMAYLGFRFVEEFLREGERPALGLSLYQLAALAGLAWFALREARTPAAAGPQGSPTP